MTGADVKKALDLVKRAVRVQKDLKKGRIDLTEARLRFMCLEDEARALGIPIPMSDYTDDDME